MIIFSCILSIIGLIEYKSVHSESPSFGRQQIIDYPSDWYAENTSQQYFSEPAYSSYLFANKLFHAENISDISSVTLTSDGKILNVTLWLTGPFNEHPTKTSPDYYIRFDTDSNLGTGDKFGADYLFIVSWNNDTQSWEKSILEYSPKGHVRTVQTNNLTNFYSKLDSQIINGKLKQSDYLDCCYVYFPVDLKLMNYPSNYVISFHIKDNIHVNQTIAVTDKIGKIKKVQVNGVVEYLDSTADVSIPTPTYEFAKESQIINLTENHKLAPLIIKQSCHKV